MSKFDGRSLDIEQANKEKLRSVFPECFTEGMLDIDKLLSLCGEYIDNDFEKYKFEWKGKSECLHLAQRRSTGTLRPCIEESLNFYDTQNVYIEGDNLEVLKLLQTAYFGKVKMIYIDPPYNTGNDFVYNDTFSDPIAHYKEITSQATKSNPETMGRFHTNWLNMMYPRLRLAANLLRNDGVIFISIDDNEVDNLKKICNEVFGEENFVACVTWQKKYTRSNDSKWFSETHDYILVYMKNKENTRLNLLSRSKEQVAAYSNPDNHPKGPWKSTPLHAKSGIDSSGYTFSNGITWSPPVGTFRRFSDSTMQEMDIRNEIWFGNNGKSTPSRKSFLCDVKNGITPVTIWTYDEVGHNHEATAELAITVSRGLFDNPKPVRLINQILQLSTDINSNDIILDFFSGSATTAHSVMQLNANDGGNRKFICVQLPELTDEKSEAYKSGYKNICEIGKERIRRASAKILENYTPPQAGGDLSPLDVGFKVFKLDTSSFWEWDSTPVPDDNLDILNERLKQAINSIKPDRSDLDVIYEVNLKMGVPLDMPITTIEINDKTAYSVGDLYLLICLDGDITPDDITLMADYAPGKIVCAESSFADDSALSNAYYILKIREIELKLV